MENSAPEKTGPAPGAAKALTLLLAINLFNYLDRQVLAAVVPNLRADFFGIDSPESRAQTGLLATAFLLSYMIMAPVFGWLADRYSRWTLAGISVAIWSLASGWSGMATGFGMLLLTRVMVGIGEAGYGPSAPTIISDLYPVARRSRVLSFFYLAMPVGSALGYVFGGMVAAHWGWRWAFLMVVPPGLILAALCFFMQDPRKTISASRPPAPKPTLRDYRNLFKIRAYTFNTAAMTAMTFAIGGISFWIPDYIFSHRTAEFAPSPQLLGSINTIFGIITVVAGLLGTLFGGWAGDRVRKRFPSSYFLVSGFGILFAFPPTVAMLFLPFPYAWGMIFLAVFFLFFNTGPANAALINVTPARTRSTAFALNILIVHAFGDAISPPLIGWIGGKYGMNTAFLIVSATMVIASIIWFCGARHLERDTIAAEASA